MTGSYFFTVKHNFLFILIFLQKVTECARMLFQIVRGPDNYLLLYTIKIWTCYLVCVLVSPTYTSNVYPPAVLAGLY